MEWVSDALDPAKGWLSRAQALAKQLGDSDGVQENVDAIEAFVGNGLNRHASFEYKKSPGAKTPAVMSSAGSALQKSVSGAVAGGAKGAVGVSRGAASVTKGAVTEGASQVVGGAKSVTGGAKGAIAGAKGAMGKLAGSISKK